MLGWEDLMKAPPEIDWLIKGVLPAKRTAMLYAESGVGKSLTVHNIACHIATGKPWQGREVGQGLVYYVAAENADTYNGLTQAWEKVNRGQAYWERHHKQMGETAPPMRLDPTAVDLLNPKAVEALIGRIGTAKLVVIDTLLASVGAGEGEITDPSDIARMEEQAKEIARRTGATVLIVNHKPDGGNRPLGGSAWRGGIPVRMELTRQHNGKNFGEDGHFTDGDTITLRCKKLTGSRHFPDITLTVRLIRLGRGVEVPVTVPEKGKRQSRTPRPDSATSATPSNASQTLDFAAAFALVGDDREKLRELTGLKPAAVRQRIRRLKQDETASCHAA